MARAEDAAREPDEAPVVQAQWVFEPNLEFIFLILVLGGFGLYSLVAVDRPGLPPNASPIELTLAALPGFGEYMKLAGMIAMGVGYYKAVSVFVYWPVKAWTTEPLNYYSRRLVTMASLALAFVLAFGTWFAGALLLVGFQNLAGAIR